MSCPCPETQLVNIPGGTGLQGPIGPPSTVPGPQGPVGLQGPAGVNGVGTPGTNGTNGLNAFTTTSTGFNQPAEGATINIVIGNSQWIASGQILHVTGGGDYLVTAIPDASHVTLQNLGNTAAGLYLGNVAPGVLVPAGSKVSASGLQGPTGSAGAPGTPASTAIGQNYFHAVKGGSNQILTDALHALVAFNTELFDPSNVWNISTSKWTAPATGFYYFAVQLTFTVVSASPSVNVLSLYKNGGFGVGTLVAGSKLSQSESAGSTPQSVALATALALTAGDTIEVDTIETSGAFQTLIGSNTDTFICGFRVA